MVEIDCTDDPGAEDLLARHGDRFGWPRTIDRVYGFFACREIDDRRIWRLYHPTNGCYLEGDTLDVILSRTREGEGSVLELREDHTRHVRVVCPPDAEEAKQTRVMALKTEMPTTPWHRP